MNTEELICSKIKLLCKYFFYHRGNNFKNCVGTEYRILKLNVLKLVPVRFENFYPTIEMIVPALC